MSINKKILAVTIALLLTIQIIPTIAQQNNASMKPDARVGKTPFNGNLMNYPRVNPYQASFGYVENTQYSTISQLTNKALKAYLQNEIVGSDIKLERKWNGYIYYPTIPLDYGTDIDNLWIKAKETQKLYQTAKSLASSGYSELIPNPVDTTGNLSFLAILVDFQDIKFKSGHNDTYFWDMLNNETKPSLKTYYIENSYGKLNITIDVYGPVTSSYNLSYYGADGSGIDNGNGPIYELAREAVNLADPYVDYSKYDNNGDGFVDAVLIIHAGTGQEWSKNSTDIWSHRWSIASPPFLDGVYVKDYSMQPEHYPPKPSRPNGASILGVLAHEFGHILGLPDLYDIDYSSEGIGDWGLMGGGGWLGVNILGDNPAHLCAWSKIFLGFKKPISLTPEYTSLNTLTPVETGGDIIKLPVPNHPGEYFLLEYRYNNSGALFDKALPGSGLAIWHVDEKVAFLDWDNDGNNNWVENHVNKNETHYMVDIEEYDHYDGTQELELNTNSGESTDVWTDTVLGFSDITNPGSTAYDGSLTGLAVYNISRASSSITFGLKANIIELRENVTIANKTLYLESSISVVNKAVFTLVNVDLYINSTKPNQFNIYVNNGTFSVINSSIRSVNNSNTYLVIGYSGTNITVVNSTFSDSGYRSNTGSYLSGLVAYPNCNLTIKDALFTKMYRGIVSYGATNVKIVGSRITNNWYGVLMINTSSPFLTNNIFENNTVGLVLSISTNAIIENNVFIGDNPVFWGNQISHYSHSLNNNTVNGKPIHYMLSTSRTTAPSDGGPIIIVDSFDITISKTIIDNVDVPIQIALSRQITINTIYARNVSTGIISNNVLALTIENLIVQDSITGLYLMNTTDASITYSSIKNNKGNGIEIDGSSQLIRVEFSNIFSNDGFGILNSAASYVNATKNWWGSPSGPEYKNSSDIYDPEEIWGNITYNPWLTAPIEKDYYKIINLTYPTKVITGSNFGIIVETSYNFTTTTDVKLVLVNSANNSIIKTIYDALSGYGNKTYNITLRADSQKTNMSIVIKAYYNDTLAGWVKSSESTMNIEILPPHPIINIITPTNNTVITGNNITIVWAVEKSYYPLTTLEIKLNNGNWINVTTTNSYTFTNLTNGTNTITLRAHDTSGQTSQTKITITTIQILPKIKIISPRNNTTTINKTITIEWNITKGTFTITKTEIRLDNGSWTDVTGKNNYTYSNLTTGIHKIEIKATDSAGYTVIASITIKIVEPTHPKIQITTPTNGTTINTNNITIEWTTTQGYYNISKIEIRLDNGPWIDVTGKTSYTFQNLTTGTHTVTLKITDTSGYTSETTVTFEVSQQTQQGGGQTPTLNTAYIIAVAGVLVLLAIIMILRRRK